MLKDNKNSGNKATTTIIGVIVVVVEADSTGSREEGRQVEEKNLLMCKKENQSLEKNM